MCIIIKLHLFDNRNFCRYESRWCFDVELVYLCKRLGIQMVEVAVSWTEIPGSKVRLLSIVHMLFELVLIRVGYGLGIWKVHS
jgi:dolichyl-phosphate beta-glucosyltransferase